MDNEKEPLFFHPKSKSKYMLEIKKIQCFTCGKYIKHKENFTRMRTYVEHKKKFEKFIDYFCRDNDDHCLKPNKMAKFSEFLDVNYIDFLPEGCIYFEDLPPQFSGMSDSGTTIDAALGKHVYSDQSNATIINNTRLAGRESLEGAKIGRDVTAELEEKDRPRSIPELNRHFEKLLTDGHAYIPFEYYKNGKKFIMQKDVTEITEDDRRLILSWDEKKRANPDFKLSQNDIDQLLGRKPKQIK
jgi:hypothetical protein